MAPRDQSPAQLCPSAHSRRQPWGHSGYQPDFQVKAARVTLLILRGVMILRLRHLTPGYFRLLQMQLAGGLESEPKDRLLNRLALSLAIMGLSLSYYSVRQMAQPVKPHREQ